MTDIAIRVENLSKLYPARSFGAGHIGMLQQRHDTTSTVLSAGLRDALTGFLPRITRSQKSNSSNSSNSWQAPASHDGLWALRDVSFETYPGRVGSLLEVGAGFHPGRQ
ncbi:MAG TPA: hypothetical protein PKM78_05875 [Anaerolineae bacterium]|nr:hypothetical protein [Anaerolineae bacterium]HNU03485.1 hypothetical protein [Anaerolineae bacterium]